MRLLPVLLSLALLASAGCLGIGKTEDPPLTPAATEEDAAPVEETPAEPASEPPSEPPASPPPSSPPAATQPPPPPAPPAPPAPRVNVFSWNGSITAVGGGVAGGPAPTVCCAQAAADSENADVTFVVGEGLRGIVAELVWTDPQFDLDLHVEAPDFDVAPAPPETSSGHRWIANQGAPGQPDRHARLVLTDEASLALVGEWAGRVGVKGPANAVAFSIYVSLFLDEPPAEDYSAVPSGNP